MVPYYRKCGANGATPTFLNVGMVGVRVSGCPGIAGAHASDTMLEIAEMLVGPLVSATQANATFTPNQPGLVEEILQEAEWTDQVVREPRPRLAVRVTTDSVLVYCHPETGALEKRAEGLDEVLRYCIATSARCSEEAVYLRGAISCGEFVTRARGVPVYMGLAMHEAMYWEGQQEWAGVMLAPSALDFLYRGFDSPTHTARRGIPFVEYLRTRSTHYRQYDVPLKPGHPPLLYPPVVADVTQTAGTGYTTMLRNRYVPPKPEAAPDPRATNKLQNTVDFVAAQERRVRAARVRFND